MKKLTDTQFDKTIRLAVSTFGRGAQTQMLFEEISEPQNALCKYARGRDNANHVCEEIADVVIMCMQMAYIYGQNEVDKWMNIKIHRLYNRLAKNAACMPAPSSAGEVCNGDDALLRPLIEKGNVQ